MLHSHVLGYIIRKLREQRVGGATVSELMAFMKPREYGPARDPSYFTQAFCQTNFGLIKLMSREPPIAAEKLELYAASHVDTQRMAWEKERFPELMRVRDYFSFLQCAKDENVIIVVCGANPLAGKFIGRPSCRCYMGRTFVLSRETPPNEGLIAADPADARLQAALQRYVPSLSYTRYVNRLKSDGYRVLGPETGYLLDDGRGNRIYEGYRLHGVYDAKSDDDSAWTAERGEKLRATLNRRLGEELIQHGPQDDWEFRQNEDVAGPLTGPLAPFILFNEKQEIENYLRLKDVPWQDHWYDGHIRRRYHQGAIHE